MRQSTTIKKIFTVLLTFTLIIGTCFTANANTNQSKYTYSIANGVITEKSSFFDDEGNLIQLTRITQPNGNTQVTSICGEEKIVKTGNINYNVIKSRISHEESTRGDSQYRADITHGPNCYHVELATNEITVTKEEAGASAAALAAVLATSFTANPSIIASVAGKAYRFFSSSDINYEIITEQVNEVYFKADDVYYTHCYHDNIDCYDDFDHYVKSYSLRHEAVGG